MAGPGRVFSSKVTLEGDRELLSKLKKMSSDSQGEALDIAAQAGAEVFRDQASRNAPVQMGDLRRSLHTAKID